MGRQTSELNHKSRVGEAALSLRADAKPDSGFSCSKTSSAWWLLKNTMLKAFSVLNKDVAQ
jgi:hypothetical protein